MSCLDSNWLFAGDPHGVFDPINTMAELLAPAVTVLLGDYGLEALPLEAAVAPALAASSLWWIPGNHDVRTEAAYDCVFGSALAERNLHGRVVVLDGVRVAGLGGHFQEKVRHPDTGSPAVHTRRQFIATMGRGNVWRGGLPRHKRAVIWPEDVSALRAQKADVLVTHEAPSCHPRGFRVIDELARAMSAGLIVHGHTHLTYRFDAADGRLTVLGVGHRGVTDGAGTAWVPGDRDHIKASGLFTAPANGRPRPAGWLSVPALNTIRRIA